MLIRLSPDTDTTSNDSAMYDKRAFADLDINQPNEACFKHVDSLLELCNQMNMVVMAAPLYLGCCHDGWLEVIEQYKDPEKNAANMVNGLLLAASICPTLYG